MEHLVNVFIRVQRSADDGEALCTAFPDLEALALSKLLLLTRRYWTKGPGLREAGAQAKANNDLITRSKECYKEITSRLNKMREPLYEEHEANAIENTAHEFYRRSQESVANRPGDLTDGLGETVGQAPDSPSTLSSTKDAALDDTELEALRKQSQVMREVSQNADGTADGLRDSILHNTFLVVDHASINSVMLELGINGAYLVDDMWVWAVDPDWTPGNRRRFHSNQPLERSWAAAAASKNQAFVSIDENEARLFRVDFAIGSALRP
ncbi:hypothetical protein F5Y08DRAFT_346430 [Xylaria arbuscula]|nr:hypothetical protein F5Y08DRAFT_346430 [Xylaria arbuscula]